MNNSTTSDKSAADTKAADAKLRGESYKVRRAQVAAIQATILRDGSPELHDDTSATCIHFKLRRGFIPGDGGRLDACEAQIFRHEAGQVIRFWVYGPDFSVKVRDLVLLPTADKGADVWLEADGELFPHEGKYLTPGFLITLHAMRGR